LLYYSTFIPVLFGHKGNLQLERRPKLPVFLSPPFSWGEGDFLKLWITGPDKRQE